MPDPIDRFKGEYEFLSNFYPAIIVHDGITYPTVEHAYQAAKTLDFAERWRISKLPTPGEAKRAGRSVKLRPDWKKVRIDIMRELLLQKFFLSDGELGYELQSTSCAELIEGNWWGDTFWGVCKGQGENHLGKLLMEIRDLL